MSCTLEELQQVEYSILCAFDDFCTKHNLNYVLHGGTLLGAIRHNGFIPWDDDVDVIMDIRSFKKFIRLYKKNPIEGFHLSWIDCDGEYPLYFAKLRKDNTSMPEYDFRHLNMHKGVWIDIFTYIDKPRTELGVIIQEALLGLFQMMGEKHLNRRNKPIDNPINNYAISAFIDKCPDKLLLFLRKIIFGIAVALGQKNSEYVRDYDYNGSHNFCEERRLFEPTTKHIFVDRYFNIPENYDSLLTLIYGDYMTPVHKIEHVVLDKIDINLDSE